MEKNSEKQNYFAFSKKFLLFIEWPLYISNSFVYNFYLKK